jgi:hypothetical protein
MDEVGSPYMPRVSSRCNKNLIQNIFILNCMDSLSKLIVHKKEEEQVIVMPSNEDETRQGPNFVKEKKDWN